MCGRSFTERSQWRGKPVGVRRTERIGISERALNTGTSREVERLFICLWAWAPYAKRGVSVPKAVHLLSATWETNERRGINERKEGRWWTAGGGGQETSHWLPVYLVIHWSVAYNPHTHAFYSGPKIRPCGTSGQAQSSIWDPVLMTQWGGAQSHPGWPQGTVMWLKLCLKTINSPSSHTPQVSWDDGGAGGQW